MSAARTSEFSLQERILLYFARDPGDPEVGATRNYSIENCLDFALKSVPDLVERIRGRRVLDIGCGPGWHAVALKKLGASEVWGVDILDQCLEHGRTLAKENAVSVNFVNAVPEMLVASFDVVLSILAFDHFADPEGTVRSMRSFVNSTGQIIITWDAPWYSHSGSHVGNFTKIPGTDAQIPWCNLLFSDQALLTLRSRYRADHPDRIEDIEGGLNKMTVARFEAIMRQSGMSIERLHLHPTLGLPFVRRIPVVRELLTSSATCILRPYSV